MTTIGNFSGGYYYNYNNSGGSQSGKPKKVPDIKKNHPNDCTGSVRPIPQTLSPQQSKELLDKFRGGKP